MPSGDELGKEMRPDLLKANSPMNLSKGVVTSGVSYQTSAAFRSKGVCSGYLNTNVVKEPNNWNKHNKRKSDHKV